ncbi:roadblock/LC7 domain-containing protein [Stenotrophomonas sp. Marseille-Q4652]|uniref:roadblock/LC7 domain-containing protein n=1 Tax=Stenotrophomonas sp. Marseille-Q4652 TaxID=2866595 RepID=UPI001CE3C8A9|nr:roadblock/LC7 domain-containing protein [Stenotrophomonas sp. Marseille-Q4652]
MNAIALPHPQRAQDIRQALEGLNASSADIEASALISIDGLLIDSVMPQGMDEDRIGAMSAALLSLGERTARELGRGRLERVLVQGENGYVIMTAAGEEAVLTVLTKAEVKLGLAFLDIKRAAQALSRLV